MLVKSTKTPTVSRQELKAMGPGCGLNANSTARKYFPEKLCYKVFNGFWQMGGTYERRNYVMCYISKKEVALRVRTTNDPGSRKKKNSLQYALPKERC